MNRTHSGLLLLLLFGQGAAVAQGEVHVPEVELALHDYQSAKVFAISASDSAGALNALTSAEDVEQSASSVTESRSFVYIGRLLSILESGAEVACRPMESLTWRVDLQHSDGVDTFVGDGHVVLGPDGKCRQGESLRSLDVLDHLVRTR